MGTGKRNHHGMRHGSLRIRRGWNGRAAAIFAALGFVAVMFTYIGVNTFLPGVHSYA